MFAEKSKKVFNDVCFQRFAVDCVFNFSQLFFIIFPLLLISQFFVISTFGGTLLIIWCRFVKYIF